MSVIDLNQWKEQKRKKQLEKDREDKPTLYVDQFTGKIYGKKQERGVEALSNAFPKLNLDRLQRVKVSMDKIDRIVSELKKLNEQYNSPR